MLVYLVDNCSAAVAAHVDIRTSRSMDENFNLKILVPGYNLAHLIYCNMALYHDPADTHTLQQVDGFVVHTSQICTRIDRHLQLHLSDHQKCAKVGSNYCIHVPVCDGFDKTSQLAFN